MERLKACDILGPTCAVWFFFFFFFFFLIDNCEILNAPTYNHIAGNRRRAEQRGSVDVAGTHFQISQRESPEARDYLGRSSLC